jgi:hypothetical protein
VLLVDLNAQGVITKILNELNENFQWKDYMRFGKSIFILSVCALLLPSLTEAYRAEVARTGQTTCYDAAGAVISCAGTGQDGAIQAGAVWPDPRFSERTDGTVSDNLTGLVWTKNANLPNVSVTWQNALNYVAGMNAGTYPNFGHTDWRLPNVNELESLVHAGVYNPALPVTPFTQVQPDYYWSSTIRSQTATSGRYGKESAGQLIIRSFACRRPGRRHVMKQQALLALLSIAPTRGRTENCRRALTGQIPGLSTMATIRPQTI